MADETPREADANPPVPEAKPPEAETEPPEAALDDGPERIAALEAEVADLKDRLLRTLAEMENLRRRSEREMADTRQYAVANFARDMLTVSDNLRRALDAVPSEPQKDADPALAALIEGVEVTERGLAQTLQKFGVRSIEAKGEKFDPSHHQAMFEIETAEVPAGTVAEVVQTGYIIGERVLRPSMVGVAKGPKPAAKANGEGAADDDGKKAGAKGEAQPADGSTG
jgi:molecular chaperone GrpE